MIANRGRLAAIAALAGAAASATTAASPTGLFQKSVNAVKAWADIVKANGGLAGRKVVVDFCDSKLDPNATTNCVINACQNDFALVGTSANALEDLSDLDGCKNAAGKAIGIPDLAAFAFLPLACDGIIGPTNVGGHRLPNCDVITQLVNGQWQRVYPTKPGTFDCKSGNTKTIKMNVTL